jgi:hypothetical protein
LGDEKRPDLGRFPDQPPEAQIVTDATISHLGTFGDFGDLGNFRAAAEGHPLKVAHYIGLKRRPRQIRHFEVAPVYPLRCLRRTAAS